MKIATTIFLAISICCLGCIEFAGMGEATRTKVRVFGEVTFANGEPALGITVMLFPADWADNRSDHGNPTTGIASDGTYEIKGRVYKTNCGDLGISFKRGSNELRRHIGKCKDTEVNIENWPEWD